jgi:hypothetical protein
MRQLRQCHLNAATKMTMGDPQSSVLFAVRCYPPNGNPLSKHTAFNFSVLHAPVPLTEYFACNAEQNTRQILAAGTRV